MAEIIGAPGRNAYDESYKRMRTMIWMAYVAVLASGVFLGMLIWGGRSVANNLTFLALLVAASILIYKVYESTGQYEIERRNWRKGADGEVVVSNLLSDLPDEYVIVNDVNRSRRCASAYVD